MLADVYPVRTGPGLLEQVTLLFEYPTGLLERVTSVLEDAHSPVRTGEFCVRGWSPSC